jgi:predicted nucleic acid-binding protein
VVFVDTNVLVYSVIREAPLHDVARRALRGLRDDDVEGWISGQVLRECLAVLTRPSTFHRPLAGAEAALWVRRLGASFRVAEDHAQVRARLLALVETVAVGGKQVHDANIVATMLEHGVTRLLTHNVKDFRRFEPDIELLDLESWAAAARTDE